MARSGKVKRKTKETNITLTFDLDGSGESRVTTGVGFFDQVGDDVDQFLVRQDLAV